MKEEFPERTFKTEQIYNGRIIKLRKDTIILPDGRTTAREIVEHPGAVVILAEKKDNKIIFVRQFRKAVEEYLLELPAGTIEPLEKTIDCARRELEEETGYQAEDWQEIYSYFSAPGFCNEKLTFYFAQNLIKTSSHTDQDEFIEIVEVDKEEIINLLKNGKIKDAKSLVGILWWLNK